MTMLLRLGGFTGFPPQAPASGMAASGQEFSGFSDTPGTGWQTAA